MQDNLTKPFNIHLNGNSQTLNTPHTLQTFLAQLTLGKTPFAVEVNGALVPRSCHAQYQLVANDRVEIVQAIGGG